MAMADLASGSGKGGIQRDNYIIAPLIHTRAAFNISPPEHRKQKMQHEFPSHPAISFPQELLAISITPEHLSRAACRVATLIETRRACEFVRDLQFCPDCLHGSLVAMTLHNKGLLCHGNGLSIRVGMHE